MPQDWIERLQRLERATAERSTAATANLQRLVAAAAAPGFRHDLLVTEMSRLGQEQGMQAYQRVAEAGVRFMARTMQVAAGYRDDYLRGFLPSERILAAGPPPSVPPPPSGNGPFEWSGWYPLLAAWVTEQQAWSAKLCRALLDESASGRLDPGSVQTSGRAFVESRLPEYLVDMAELNADLVYDILAMTDASLDALSGTLVDQSSGPDLVMDVRGRSGALATTGLLIENNQPGQASVTCFVAPADGFGLTTEPVAFRLESGESRPLAVHVNLPPEPINGRVPAGSIVVQRQGERDLVVQVRAQSESADGVS